MLKFVLMLCRNCAKKKNASLGEGEQRRRGGNSSSSSSGIINRLSTVAKQCQNRGQGRQAATKSAKSRDMRARARAKERERAGAAEIPIDRKEGATKSLTAHLNLGCKDSLRLPSRGSSSKRSLWPHVTVSRTTLPERHPKSHSTFESGEEEKIKKIGKKMLIGSNAQVSWQIKGESLLRPSRCLTGRSHPRQQALDR